MLYFHAWYIKLISFTFIPPPLGKHSADTLFVQHCVIQQTWWPRLNVTTRLCFAGGVQNGTNLRRHRLLPGPAGQPLLMPRRCSLSRTFNSFVWRSAKIHSAAESRCHGFHLEVFMHLHFNCFLFCFFFGVFQGEHRSTIEKSYFCKRKKNKCGRSSMNLPLLAQATGDVNSQICPMVHKIFTWDSLCVCTVLGWVLLIHSCLYANRTLVKKTKRKARAINTAFSLFLLKILSSLLIPVCCSLALCF